jgi:hypothetical protein
MYIYENHLGGGLYATVEELDFDARFCETCGDCEMFIGEANNRKEAFRLITRMTYTKEHKREFLDMYFPKYGRHPDCPLIAVEDKDAKT